jgi:hypothetical protein
MSQATVKLLQAAAEILGGDDALARHLNIGEVLMSAYLEGRRPLPDFLLLRAVDVVLERTKAVAPAPAAAPGLEPALRAAKTGSS